MISLAALGVGRRAEWRHLGQLARGGDGHPSCVRAASAVQVRMATNRYPGVWRCVGCSRSIVTRALTWPFQDSR